LRLTSAETAGRASRLARLERAARVWVNGVEVGRDPRLAHLAEAYE
jgi:hypothetical protein